MLQQYVNLTQLKMHTRVTTTSLSQYVQWLVNDTTDMLLLATFTIIPSPFLLLHLHYHHTCACYLYHTCTRICMFMCPPLGRRPHWSTTGGPPTSDNGHQWSPYQAIPTTCTIQWSPYQTTPTGCNIQPMVNISHIAIPLPQGFPDPWGVVRTCG